MFLFKLSIHVQHNSQKKIINALFSDLLASLWQNGQIFDHYDHSSTYSNNILSYFVRCPEKNALSKKYRNDSVQKTWHMLEDKAGNNVATDFLGKDVNTHFSQCRGKRSFYILYTNFLATGSPLRCGDCFVPIPLYQIPPTDHENYMDIFWWESQYKACDTLQIGSTVGAKFGLREISYFDSTLTQTGLNICKKVENSTGKKTFYFLLNYKKISKKQDREKKCPSCHQQWLLQQPLHGLFNFQCKKCGLLSNLTSY